MNTTDGRFEKSEKQIFCVASKSIRKESLDELGKTNIAKKSKVSRSTVNRHSPTIKRFILRNRKHILKDFLKDFESKNYQDDYNIFRNLLIFIYQHHMYFEFDLGFNHKTTIAILHKIYDNKINHPYKDILFYGLVGAIKIWEKEKFSQDYIHATIQNMINIKNAFKNIKN